MNRWHQHYLAPALLVCCAVFIDLIVRFPYFKRMQFPDAFIYALSILFEVAFILLFLRLMKKSALAGRLFLLIYFFGAAACYTFYIYFKDIPGVNTFSYMFLEPDDFFGIAGDGVNIWCLLAAAVVVAAAWRPLKSFLRDIQTCSTRAAVILAVLLVSTAAILNLAISQKDNRALPITNSLFSIINGYRDFHQNKLTTFELMHRNISLKQPEARKTPEFNLLVIINESLSAEYCIDYGYPLNTTPNISDFMAHHRRNTFLFPRAFSNSTITKVSVPSLMAGLNPIQGRYQLGQSPLFYEALKNSYDSYRTGLITSWSYKAANFVEFMDSPHLDYYRYLENSDMKKVCNVGGDDALITSHFREFLGGLDNSEKFCATLHYANTHYPYYSKPGDRRFILQNRILSDYLGAVHNLDRNISDVLDLLKERGLLDNTVVIFTSDHGECFGEVGKRNGHLGLFSVYTTRVPLWMYVPEKVFAMHPEFRTGLERNVSRNVCNTDIFPTVMDLYGLGEEHHSRFGYSLLSDVPENRNIFIFNGLKENRTDNQEYICIIRRDDFFAVTKEVDYGEYFLFNLRDVAQTRNNWGLAPENDSTFIALLRREKMDMFVLKPPEEEHLFLALLDGHHLGKIIKSTLNLDNQPKIP